VSAAPTTPDAGHLPVMLAEVLAALAPRAEGLYVDGTFGAGGYSRAILAAAPCRVVAFDRDPEAIARGAPLASAAAGRLELIEASFGTMRETLGARGIEAVDGVALDLGVSSQQLESAERGFSFRTDGPLDMRMGRSGESAADLVNRASEEDLVRILRDYGEERRAAALARAIVARRRGQPFARTLELAELVRSLVRAGAGNIDPATRTFLALRIAVNDELGELERGLVAAEQLLRPHGRLVVVAFHSLEDRCVKRFLSTRGRPAPSPSRHLPPCATLAPRPSFRLLHGHALRPSEGECRANPRARSARLRAAERTAAPAFTERRAA
jgi:16S rRNA (cytosine1402-N4)-methyltransferase